MNNIKTELQKIRERSEKATQGDWYRTTSARLPEDRQYVRSKEYTRSGTIDHGICETWGGNGPNEDDAEFIAHARTDIPKLLTCVERLVEGLEKIGCGHVLACDCIEDAEETSKITLKEASAILTGESEKGMG